MVLGLLAGILFVQVANHERPLTLAAYKAATAEQRKELMN
jgi:hypothetical protein